MKKASLAERVVFLSDGKLFERIGCEERELKVESVSEDVVRKLTRRRAISIESGRLRFKEELQFSSDEDKSEFLSEAANANLETLGHIYARMIQAIAKRKNLTINEVPYDEEVQALLKERDGKLRKLNAITFDAATEDLSEREMLKEKILAAKKDMRVFTLRKLAKKLNRHSWQALRMEMKRCGLSIKDFKK